MDRYFKRQTKGSTEKKMSVMRVFKERLNPYIQDRTL